MCVPALGAAVGLATSIYSGLTQAANYRAQADAARLEGRMLSEQGSYESARQDERNKVLTGEQVTGYASSGVDIWGTPGDVIASSRAQGELDKMAIRTNAQNRSNYKRYEAQIADANAGIATVGGVIGGIAPLVSGFTSLRTSFG